MRDRGSALKASSKGGLFAFIRTVAAYLVLPNLVFWIAGAEFELLPRALFNLDYLAVATLAPFVSTSVAVALLSAALVIDTFRCSGSIYYFSQRDALSALVYLRELSIMHVACITTLLVCTAVVFGWVVVRAAGQGLRFHGRALWVGLFTLTFGVVGVWGGNSSLRFRDDSKMPNLCTSAAISMAKTALAGILRSEEQLPPEPIDSATRHAGWFGSTPRQHNLVLVVLESGGRPIDPKMLALFARPFQSTEIRMRYEVSVDTVPFGGATIPGEFREVCGIKSAVTVLPPQESLQSCLAARYHAKGYETIYFHGYAPSMFRRREWLGKVGFEKQFFHPELRKLGLADCGGPFRGTCDEEIAKWMGDYLVRDAGRQHFIEFLTLNSHLPVFPEQDSSALLGCGTAQAEVADDAACNLLGLVLRVETAIARVAARPDLPPTEFVIVGDHAPPFMQRTRRETFSQHDVPAIYLKPRS